MSDALQDWMRRYPGMVPEPPETSTPEFMSDDELLHEIVEWLEYDAAPGHRHIIELVKILHSRAEAED